MSTSYGSGTFRDRIKEAIRLCDNNQSELARRVSKLLGEKVSPQSIQYLAAKGRTKSARGSRRSAAIAAAVGLNAEWVAFGRGPKFASERLRESTDQAAGGDKVYVRVEPTTESKELELSRAAVEVAWLWSELSGDKRRQFKEALERASKTETGATEAPSPRRPRKAATKKTRRPDA